jgi:mono/diheme cytochrome c family protein
MHSRSDSRHGALSQRVLVLGLLLLGLAAGGFLLWRHGRPPAERPPDEPQTLPEDPVALGARLYQENCAACHGERGAGDGPAAKFLFPRPRNFRQGGFRMVSTVNRLPSDDDLLRVITRGLPGSAMFPFAHLGEDQRQALAAHVRLLTRTAVEERIRQEAREARRNMDEEKVVKIVDRLTVAGAPLPTPVDWPAATAASLARGRETFVKICAPCHGALGKGDGIQEQVDDTGTQVRPRNLTRGIFKSGRDPRQLYARVRLGLPGSPMSAAPDDSPPEEIMAVVQYVLSLSDPALQTRAEHKRTLLTARRAGKPLPDVIPDEEWAAAPAAALAVTPLSWRDYEEPDLAVSALHDGTSLAIRLTWHDRTRNTAAIRPQDFEDMAAVQLFKGSPEPFLGMGAAGKPVDLWLWNPGMEAPAGSFADMDSAYPNMAVDLYPFEQPGAGPRAHAPERQPADFVTARRAGNLRSDPEHDWTASSLHAGGFGSATMRPRASQLVRAHGVYQGKEGSPDARWSVVLRRPLAVPPEGGIALAVGDRLSVAFALWDGAAHDRNGQKFVSIWHDLQLEP